MNNAIEVIGFGKRYKHSTLQDISFTVPEGFITGLVGPSGTGKTTIINAILGQIRGDSGRCLVFGKNAYETPVLREDVGIVLDSLIYMRHLTPDEIEKQLVGFYSKWSHELFRHYLNFFELPLDIKMNQYSKGMQMKFMLAVALAHSPKLLILDEPTSGYDIKLTEFLPEYEKYGRSAPLKRNITIIEHSDLVLAFWDGASRGTKFVIDNCKKRGIPVRVFTPEQK